MARDPDEFASWAFVTFGSLFGAALIVGLVLLIANTFMTAGDKRACRAAGHVVVTSGDEWHCSGALPERAP